MPTSKHTVRYVVSVFDRRGRGLRRAFGPFRVAGTAQALADKINAAAEGADAPRADNGKPAISAGVGYLHSGPAATIKNCVTDAPHPDTFKRPSES